MLPPARGCPCALHTGAGTRGIPLPNATTTDYPAIHLTRTVKLPPSGGHLDVPLTITGRDGKAGSTGLILVSVTVGAS